MNSSTLLVLIVLSLVLFIMYKFSKKFKGLKLDSITIINGGVKCGKTTLAVHLAIKTYKRNLLRYYIRSTIQKVFRMKRDEKPILYSNIPLKCDYVPLTYDHLLRNVRFTYKSVVLLSESSLVLGSMDFKDDNVNESITLFVKLFGHETKGGSMFIETQCINDNHFAFKRGINRFIWIDTLIKWIPFVLVYRVREMAYMDGETAIQNTFTSDVDDSTKTFIISKRAWKNFDCYCYSKLTDSLNNDYNVVKGNSLKDLKTNDVLRFKNYFKKEAKK